MVVWRWMKAEGPARTLGVVTGGFSRLGAYSGENCKTNKPETLLTKQS